MTYARTPGRSKRGTKTAAVLETLTPLHFVSPSVIPFSLSSLNQKRPRACLGLGRVKKDMGGRPSGPKRVVSEIKGEEMECVLEKKMFIEYPRTVGGG